MASLIIFGVENQAPGVSMVLPNQDLVAVEHIVEKECGLQLLLMTTTPVKDDFCLLKAVITPIEFSEAQK